MYYNVIATFLKITSTEQKSKGKVKIMFIGYMKVKLIISGIFFHSFLNDVKQIARNREMLNSN